VEAQHGAKTRRRKAVFSLDAMDPGLREACERRNHETPDVAY